MIQTAAAQTAQPASSPPVKSDVVQNGPRKFDVRARGAICDGRVTSGTWTGTDDTAAFTAAIRSFAELVIPPAPAFGSTCSIAPGTLVVPTGRNSWSLTGEGYELSTLQDNTVHPGGPLPPMLQVGNDPSKLMNSTILRGFSLSGAYGGTPSYPNGLLSLFPNNLSHIEDVWVQLPAGTNNSFGIKADGAQAASAKCASTG